MNSQYSSSTIGSNKASKICIGLIFIIIGGVLSIGTFSYYIGSSSIYISVILIVIGVIIILTASKQRPYHNVSRTLPKYCPKCGVTRSPGYTICSTCGYRFFPETKPISTIPRQQEVVKKSPYKSSFPPISELLQSKGTLESKEVVSQFKDEDQETTPSIQEKKKEVLVKFCPQCGEKFLEGAKFCFICGKKVEEVELILSDSEIKKDEPLIASTPTTQPTTQISEIGKDEPEISISDIQHSSQASESSEEEPKMTSTFDTQPISSVSEIAKDEPEMILAPESQPISPVEEEHLIITNEILEPIPPVEQATKRKLKPIICNFCGIRLPKNALFCLQCGMIIKIN
ncbi:MAG: zinc ribbon domain-containing protein [Candidatus Hermodarchaeota archaeon]